MPTKALQKLGRLPPPIPKIKNDPKPKRKPKLRTTASSRITRSTTLSRTDLPSLPEASSRSRERAGQARAATSPLTSPTLSTSDGPVSDDVVDSTVLGSKVAGLKFSESEVAKLIARCEREEVEIDKLLVEIEAQCSDNPETWPESPSTATPDYLYTVLLAKPIELDAYYASASSPASSTHTSIDTDTIRNASATPSPPSTHSASPTSLVTLEQDRLPQFNFIGQDAQRYRQAIACWFPTGTSWAEPELEIRSELEVYSR